MIRMSPILARELTRLSFRIPATVLSRWQPAAVATNTVARRNGAAMNPTLLNGHTRRNYVSETKRENAQVETTVRQGLNDFASQTGTLPEDVPVPGMGIGADAMLSPTAGKTSLPEI